MGGTVVGRYFQLLQEDCCFHVRVEQVGALQLERLVRKVVDSVEQKIDLE